MTTTRRSPGPRHLPRALRFTLALAFLAALAGAGAACDGDDGDTADRAPPDTAISAADASADGASADRASTDGASADRASTDGAATGSASGASATSADGTISANGAWVRVAIRPAGSDEPGAPPVNSAGYLALRNTGAEADALVTVETVVADTAELHSVSMEGGIMRMRAVDSIPVPAGGEAVLEPGGYHIMLIGLRDALAEGDSVAMVLRLRSGAAVEFVAPVRRQ